jgi:hypothetical protein
MDGTKHTPIRSGEVSAVAAGPARNDCIDRPADDTRCRGPFGGPHPESSRSHRANKNEVQGFRPALHTVSFGS